LVRSLARRLRPAAALLALAFLASGCGDNVVSADAVVSVYVAAPLCAEAQREAGRDREDAAGPEVRVLCLSSVKTGAGIGLSRAGRNARRATEDSTSVAYLEAPGPTAKFSRSIVQAADIAWVEASSGSTAMRRILGALEGDGSSPRQAVLDELG
jgi:hypothetical protein